jgi:hypothetical protein
MCDAVSKARWLAHSPAKRYTELLFLAYSPFWMVWALGVVVPFKLYEVPGLAPLSALLFVLATSKSYATSSIVFGIAV